MRKYCSLVLAASASIFLCASPNADAPGLRAVFNGTTLEAWHLQGAARWRVQNGEIVGSSANGAGGWLVLDHPYEDFILNFSFRCSECDAGVLLRAAPLNWSHFSRPPKTGERT